MKTWHFAVDCRWPEHLSPAFRQRGVVITCREQDIDRVKPEAAIGYVGCESLEEAIFRANLMEHGEPGAYGVVSGISWRKP